jgi:hypothetical protein
MTQAKFRAFEANAVAYEQSHGPQIIAAYRRSHPSQLGPPGELFKRGETLASLIAKQAEQQPRVRGAACGGSRGVGEATPAFSIWTPGSYLVAGAGTSCSLAQEVATAVGDSSEPQSAVLSVPDRITGRRLTLRCHGLSSNGPVECTGRGADVYVGSYEAPLAPSN